MSFISALPFRDTLSYWWGALDGEPGRIGFMARKLVEVSAFLDNYYLHRNIRVPEGVSPSSPPREPVPVPEHPAVFVVVPALLQGRKEEDRLAALLQALAAQTHPCHPIVVDDGSPAPVRTSSAEVMRLPSHTGPAAARNHGIEQALGLGADIIALTDADCLPATDWIASLVAGFHSLDDAHAIAGTTWSRDRCGLGRYHDRNGTLNGRERADGRGLLYGPTCNLALCADLALALDFDESFTLAAAEDIDFCYRANQDGWRIRHWPSAEVHHDFGYDAVDPVRRLRNFWRQFRRYSTGERHLLEKHPYYYRAFSGSKEIPCQAVR